MNRVSFDLERGGSLALVGDSGSGKTTLALSLPGLLPPDAEVTGQIEVSGRIGMVFHDPLSALNPVMRVGDQIAEAAGRRQVASLLSRVGLEDGVARAYPHQLSGGMRQRALIAMAIGLEPSVLVADEPTSALDSVTQARIAELLDRLRRERGIALLLATHDLSFARRLCDQVAVLSAGTIVERGPAASLFAQPRHPCTARLLSSLARTELS